MFFRNFSATMLLAVLLTVGSTALASQGEVDSQVAAMLEARKRSASEIKSILSQLSPREKDEMLRQQRAIDAIVHQAPDPAELDLTEDERERLWNATKVIDALIARNSAIADEQLNCRQERKLGSQLAKRNCRTKAQMEREREDSRRDFDNMQQGRP
jgi:hypothetical protein